MASGNHSIPICHQIFENPFAGCRYRNIWHDTLHFPVGAHANILQQTYYHHKDGYADSGDWLFNYPMNNLLQEKTKDFQHQASLLF